MKEFQGKIDFWFELAWGSSLQGFELLELTVNSNTGDAVLVGIYLFWTHLYCQQWQMEIPALQVTILAINCLKISMKSF